MFIFQRRAGFFCGTEALKWSISNIEEIHRDSVDAPQDWTLTVSDCVSVNLSILLSQSNFKEVAHSRRHQIKYVYFSHLFLTSAWSQRTSVNILFINVTIQMAAWGNIDDIQLWRFSVGKIELAGLNRLTSFHGFALLSLLDYWHWLICYDTVSMLTGFYIKYNKHATLFSLLNNMY